jgi:hypothetical protein
MRVSMLSYKMPELNGPKYGCFAKLPRHPPSEGQRYFQTTYQDSYSQRFNTPKSNSAFQVEHKFCGSSSNWQPADRIRITTQLISEKYNNGYEPKYNTEVQRTWINYRDPGVRAITDLGIDNTKLSSTTTRSNFHYKDNELSLTMPSDKMYNDVKAKTFYGCPKKFTDVTKTTFHVSNLRQYN